MHTNGKNGRASKDQEATTSKWDFVNGIAGATLSPKRYELLRAGKGLSKTTVFGVRDTVKGRWLFRVDGAHSTHHKYNHLNINPKLTGKPDPHVWLPPGSSFLGSTITKATQIAGPLLFATAVVQDGMEIGNAAYKDLQENDALGHRTVRATASVAAGWAGGIVGCMVGGTAGYYVGGCTSAVVGLGFAPGGAVGSLVGGCLGGAYTGAYAKQAAENACDFMCGTVPVKVLYESGSDDHDSYKLFSKMSSNFEY